MSRLRIAVTGASGFVGGAVVAAAVNRGWDVVPFGRRPGVERWDLTTGPLADPPRVDAVVHCAAAVSDWAAQHVVRPATVAGTRYVTAPFPGVRLVHLSTSSVYDPRTAQVAATEDQGPIARYTTPYAQAKADAERVLARRPNTTILRPHAVYGPGDTTLMPRVLAAVRGGLLVLPGVASTLTSLTHIDNLVSACLLACEPDAPEGPINVADAEPVTFTEALTDLFRARCQRVRIRHAPTSVVRPVAGVTEGVFRLLRRPEPPSITRYALSQLVLERTLDLTRARRELGYDPFPTTMAGAANW